MDSFRQGSRAERPPLPAPNTVEQARETALRSGMKTVRILVADDHDIIRRGLKQLLTSRSGWEVCGEAKTGREAVALVEQLKPEIVVMDISMPDLNGLEAAR